MPEIEVIDERDIRREKQKLFDQNIRLQALSRTYGEMAESQDGNELFVKIINAARILSPKSRIVIFERGSVLKAEDRLGPCDVAPNLEWRSSEISEGHSSDLLSPLFDGQKSYLCGMMGASKRIIYIDNLTEIDDSLRGDFKSFVQFCGVVITAIGAAEKDRKAATTDGLTGLPNRRALEHIITKLIEEKRRFAYVMIDLDNFKQINDKQGHAAGDTLLVKVGKILSANTRLNDYPSRLAGDEFVVILGSGDMTAGAKRVANWLEQNGVKASTGVGMYPEDGNSILELYNKADKGLYENKTARRSAGLR